VPSLELVDEARPNKAGKNAGKYAIQFCNMTKNGLKPRPRFKKYENAFNLLKWRESTGSVDSTEGSSLNEEHKNDLDAHAQT
jgi:hypothetical protein